MHLVAKSDQTTGNQTYCSYAVQSNQLVLTFTAPYSSKLDQNNSRSPHPGFVSSEARRFFAKHGLAVRAIGLLVDDASEAFSRSVLSGAIAVVKPHVLTDEESGGKQVLSEVKLYGDVVLRYISNSGYGGAFLPNYKSVDSLPLTSGFVRITNVAGVVYNLLDTVNHVVRFTGFHEVRELTSSDKSSMALASNNEMVVLAVTEETSSYGSSKSFIEENEGAGVQRLGLSCEDIFATVKDMIGRVDTGGFEFMPAPDSEYYKNIRESGFMTEEEVNKCEEFGILVDKDEHGLLLHIFTKPLGDRSTVFVEIVQRFDGSAKRRFSALFKSSLDANLITKNML